MKYGSSPRASKFPAFFPCNPLVPHAINALHRPVEGPLLRGAENLLDALPDTRTQRRLLGHRDFHVGWNIFHPQSLPPSLSQTTDHTHGENWYCHRNSSKYAKFDKARVALLISWTRLALPLNPSDVMTSWRCVKLNLLRLRDAKLDVNVYILWRQDENMCVFMVFHVRKGTKIWTKVQEKKIWQSY